MYICVVITQILQAGFACAGQALLHWHLGKCETLSGSRLAMLTALLDGVAYYMQVRDRGKDNSRGGGGATAGTGQGDGQEGGREAEAAGRLRQGGCCCESAYLLLSHSMPAT